MRRHGGTRIRGYERNRGYRDRQLHARCRSDNRSPQGRALRDRDIRDAQLLRQAAGRKGGQPRIGGHAQRGEKDRLAALVPERGGGLSPDRYEVGQAVCQAICQTARRADVAAKTGRPTPTVRDKRLAEAASP